MTFWRKYGLIYPVSEGNMNMKEMKYESDTLTNNSKEYFNEVADNCSNFDLSFGDIDADMESEVVRWAFVNRLDVDAACDAWHEAINEHMWEKVL